MSVAELPISIDYDAVANFCRTHGIRRLSLFGSVLRDDFDLQRSDVDVLAELRDDARPGFSFFGWSDELTALIGRNVDLHTPASLSKFFRDEVLNEALTIYEQA